MDDSDKSIDALFEALTITMEYEPAVSPPYGGFNGNHHWWVGYQWKADGHDIVYRNLDGKMHRIYGPAYISTNYDIEIWCKDGEYHREDGPAIKHKKNFVWYKDGVLHNLYGPAVLCPAGPKQYWIEGRKYSPKEYKKEIARRRRKGLIK
jgi:hypothetical protein